RAQPPGRQWVPGTWQVVEGGWHWVPGFWAEAGGEEIEYLPPPPPTLDRGPVTPAPVDEASDYIPRCWIYREARSRWRPGLWLAHRPDWVWVPAHYVWTTCGFVFVDGYWDRPLHERGLLFAPVRFAPRLVAAETFSYVPRFVVRLDFLLGALFV